MSQIIKFAYKSLSKLIRISNNTWENLFQKERGKNGKDG